VRVCLDTNVVVSAVATRGLCADLLVVLLAEHDLVLGETVLTELHQVLARKIRLPKETIRELDAFLRAQATVVPAATNAAHPSLEGADARVLAEAAAGGADVLVTGDRGLLGIPDAPVEVVSPRGLWERLRSPRKGPGRAT
jgi:putative PIN family toxin of toxin-antitoxin system